MPPVHPITRASDRVDELRLEPVIDLAAQPAHQHIEDVGERVVIVVPDVSRDRGAIDDLPGVAATTMRAARIPWR
jgi:hypothetical protein